MSTELEPFARFFASQCNNFICADITNALVLLLSCEGIRDTSLMHLTLQGMQTLEAR
jgi:hypothetical protein